MMCDVRQCPEDEVVPLFNKMVEGNKPHDVKWHDGHIYLNYRAPSVEIRFWVRPKGFVTFEFYTGISNIRFDGQLKDEDCIAILREASKDGKGMKVSDFIKLS